MDDDIIVYLTAHDENLHKLITFNKAYEQKKGSKNVRITEIIQAAQAKLASGELIVPYSPLPFIQLIRNSDTRGFLTYFNKQE